MSSFGKSTKELFASYGNMGSNDENINKYVMMMKNSQNKLQSINEMAKNQKGGNVKPLGDNVSKYIGQIANDKKEIEYFKNKKNISENYTNSERFTYKKSSKICHIKNNYRKEDSIKGVGRSFPKAIDTGKIICNRDDKCIGFGIDKNIPGKNRLYYYSNDHPCKKPKNKNKKTAREMRTNLSLSLLFCLLAAVWKPVLTD